MSSAGGQGEDLRVLIGMPFGSALGGAERYLRLVAERAGDYGLRLHVVFFEPGPLVGELEALGVPTSVVPLGRFRDVRLGGRALRALVGLIRSERPDVVFGWLPRAHVYLSAAAAVTRLPSARVAWWQHHAPTGEALERLATLIPAAAVFVASTTVREAQRKLRPRRRTVLSYYGIAPVEPVGESELDALRAQLGLPDGRRIAALPGRLVRWKGQDRFLEAIARLRERGTDIHGLVIGGTAHGLDDDFEPELRALVRERGLADQVTFTGQVAEPIPYLQLADVVVNASLGEPFGLTLVESQALGVPALAVGIGGPTEIIDHGETGWLVPSGAPAALADGIAELLADPQRARRIGAAGRASYERRFTADAGVARFASALRELDQTAGR